MIGAKIKTRFDRNRVKVAVKKMAFKSIFHASASLSKDAKSTLQRRNRPSPAGQPPHTGRRRLLKRAIRFAVDRETQSAVIGPIASLAGESGAAHEFGGNFKGGRFPERSFMGPALERAVPRFAGQFEGSFG